MVQQGCNVKCDVEDGVPVDDNVLGVDNHHKAV
jgi:hypothetical protein